MPPRLNRKRPRDVPSPSPLMSPAALPPPSRSQLQQEDAGRIAGDVDAEESDVGGGTTSTTTSHSEDGDQHCGLGGEYNPCCITLNVGGVLFTTTRETLLAEPNSILSHLVCSNFAGVPRGTCGTVFLDRDPGNFRHILNYLRGYELHLAPDELGLLAEDAALFQLEGLIAVLGLRPPKQWKFCAGPGISLDGTTLDSCDVSALCGAEWLHHGDHSIMFRLEKIDVVTLGLVSTSYSTCGFHGRPNTISFQSNGELKINVGELQVEEKLWLIKDNDTIKMRIVFAMPSGTTAVEPYSFPTPKRCATAAQPHDMELLSGESQQEAAELSGALPLHPNGHEALAPLPSVILYRLANHHNDVMTIMTNPSNVVVPLSSSFLHHRPAHAVEPSVINGLYNSIPSLSSSEGTDGEHHRRGGDNNNPHGLLVPSFVPSSSLAQRGIEGSEATRLLLPTPPAPNFTDAPPPLHTSMPRRSNTHHRHHLQQGGLIVPTTTALPLLFLDGTDQWQSVVVPPHPSMTNRVVVVHHEDLSLLPASPSIKYHRLYITRNESRPDADTFVVDFTTEELPRLKFAVHVHGSTVVNIVESYSSKPTH